MPRERLTARRLHELLWAEGYAGAYDSVQRHVRDWRRDQDKTGAAFVPLWFAPGEVHQFDWSHEAVVPDGVTTEVKVVHVRLCCVFRRIPARYSDASQPVIPAEASHPFRGMPATPE